VEQRDVELGIAAHNVSVELALVVEVNSNVVGVVDHVLVGDDVPLRIDDEASPEGLALHRSFTRPGRALRMAPAAAALPEEELERIHPVSAIAHHAAGDVDLLRGRDVHDHRLHLLGERGDIERRRHRRRRQLGRVDRRRRARGRRGPERHDRLNRWIRLGRRRELLPARRGRDAEREQECEEGCATRKGRSDARFSVHARLSKELFVVGSTGDSGE
jgi:hypothetical protein